MLQLRNYQQKAVNDIRQKYLEKHKSPLFVLATGGGKTVIFCHVAAEASRKGKNVLILVHRVELLRQTSRALTKSSVEHGLINPKYTPNLNARVQVASVQTLVNRLDKIPYPDLIIIDEAHHSIAGSWKKVIDYYGCRILGVTATPTRGDNKGLDNIFDTMVLGPQTPELIDMGYLVKPVIYAPPKEIDFSHVKIVRGDYDKKQTVNIMDRPTITGDAVAHYRKLCSGVACVVFCISVVHAQNVAEEFRQAGYSAYAVDGSMDDGTRTRILEGLGDGSIQVVCSCDIISEGTDIPAIECAILLRPTQSEGLYIQQVGRALRLSDGKKRAIILDHVGNVRTHGFPDDYREWTLEGRKIKRRGKRNIADGPIKAFQCKKCFAVYPPENDHCPYCGEPNTTKREHQIQKREGELELLEREKEKKRKITEVAKARTMEELEDIAKERGYKKGWAKRIFEARKNKKR